MRKKPHPERITQKIVQQRPQTSGGSRSMSYSFIDIMSWLSANRRYKKLMPEQIAKKGTVHICTNSLRLKVQKPVCFAELQLLYYK